MFANEMLYKSKKKFTVKMAKRICPFAGSILLFLLIFCYGCSLDDSKEYGITPGIVLSFDDYHISTWEQNFDLFDKYNAKVTFFVTGSSVTEFMLSAQERGHEIGYHTIHHFHLPQLTREEFFEEAISSVSVFKESGIELTSFAYPYGDYKPWMNDELLKYYSIIRGFNGFKRYLFDEMKSGFIISASIDNINYKSETGFRDNINDMVKSARDYGKIINFTSHSISGNDWGITPGRLEYVLKTCQEYGLTFYRYKDFQE